MTSASASIPYLDAFVEEVLRIAHTIGAQNRNTTEDTVILGRPIPKGTQVFFGNRGLRFVAPPLPIDESVRSETAQAALREGRARPYEEKMWYGNEDMRGDVLESARWLVTDPETGREAFDAAAWPTMPFGAGRRGCYGRKLAYMKLKMVLTLLVWKFEFCVYPEDLSGYERIQIFTSKPQKTYISLRPVP